MKFKIIYPTGYTIDNTQNDNLDVNVVLENNDVYFGTLFTISNIIHLMNKESINYFCADSMLIVRDLKEKTITTVIESLIENSELYKFFSKIGSLQEIFETNKNYHELYNNLRKT